MTRNIDPLKLSDEGSSTVNHFETQRSQTATFKITDLLDKSFRQANADFETSSMISIPSNYL